MGAGPEHYLLAHFDGSNFLFGNDDLCGHGFEIENLRDQITLFYELAF